VKAIRPAPAASRERAWDLPVNAAPGAGCALVTVDIGAAIVTGCPDKEQAAPTRKTPSASPPALFADPVRGPGNAAWLG
jgi:hypothetical protein